MKKYVISSRFIKTCSVFIFLYFKIFSLLAPFRFDYNSTNWEWKLCSGTTDCLIASPMLEPHSLFVLKRADCRRNTFNIVFHLLFAVNLSLQNSFGWTRWFWDMMPAYIFCQCETDLHIFLRLVGYFHSTVLGTKISSLLGLG